MNVGFRKQHVRVILVPCIPVYFLILDIPAGKQYRNVASVLPAAEHSQTRLHIYHAGFVCVYAMILQSSLYFVIYSHVFKSPCGYSVANDKHYAQTQYQAEYGGYNGDGDGNLYTEQEHVGAGDDDDGDGDLYS